SRTADIERIKGTIQNSRKAGPLKQQLEQLELLQQAKEEQKKELENLELEYKHSNEILTKLQNKSEEIEKDIANKELLLLKKEQLRIAVDISENLDIETARRDQSRKEVSRVKKEIARYQADLDVFKEQLQTLQNKMGDTDALVEAQQKARDTLEQAKILHGLAVEFEKEKRAVLVHQKTIETTVSELKTNQTDIEITKEEFVLLQKEIENEKNKTVAGSLAKTLKSGIACPVCGSLEHPSPAKEIEPVFSFEERRESLERRTLQLEKKHTELQKELITREANLRNAEERLQLLSLKNPNKSEIPSQIEAEENLQKAVRATQDAADTLNATRTAWREFESIRKNMSSLDASLVERNSYLNQVEKEESKADAAVKTALLRFKEAGLEPETDAEDALEICTAEILTLDAKITGHASILDDEKKRSSVLEGRIHSLGTFVSKKIQEIETASNEWVQACKTSGFTGKDEILLAALSNNEEEKREKECTAWTESCSAIAARILDIEAQKFEWIDIEPDIILSQISEAEKKLNQTDADLSSLITELSSLNSLISRKKMLETERAQRSLEAGRLQSLCDDLSGNNPAHISFDAWILGIYLEEITAYANTRLERMSEGRYSIQLNESYRKGKSLSGLELEIFDSWTGKARPSGTLSGGETFMTSISLALGLADSIQARAGGIQLDAVFIDEGFGSLDESSLERSISILDEIRGSRMVGIISHVGELRNRIPARIEVIKTGTGSSIKKEIFND
ncbi:MAG TPA: SbcC/MukB-like Walker B domain-containing protein, partial [Treponemataceae bacterium]|nr:SbcC/MukB-like Walker B domain-containing protein [Treponemataceae bacterium]